MHELIAAPFVGDYFVLRPGSCRGLRLPRPEFIQLQQAVAEVALCPPWLVAAVRDAYGVEVSGRRLTDVMLTREETPYGFGRASYELNLGCNYDCEHCYLGLKTFSGLCWDDRVRLLRILREAGVVWLQLTGGEPLLDRLFQDTYALAWESGMMLQISTNASRLHNQRILGLLTTRRPYRITVSVYGATAATYDALVRRRGAFRLFQRGIAAALEARLPLRLNIVLTRTNADEEEAMVAMAEQWGLQHMIYSNLSPTIYGGAEILPAQSARHLRARKPFTGCNAGHTSFHVDPHGMASICKVARDEQVNLIAEGAAGLRRLAPVADRMMLRTGGCAGCRLSGSCAVCRPLAKLYQEANAPLSHYCQHGRR